MSGPTWKFWLWRAADLPYAGILLGCALVIAVSFANIVLLLTPAP